MITLGATTPTYDLESIPENFKDHLHLTQEDVFLAAQKFTGEIMQVPPIYSAIKTDGKRAYELARRGKDVELKARPITINAFETTLQGSQVVFRIVCSTGTYIRSLAHDLGASLGCGGYLSELRRTRIGNFLVDDAWSMDDFEEKLKDQNG